VCYGKHRTSVIGDTCLLNYVQILTGRLINKCVNPIVFPKGMGRGTFSQSVTLEQLNEFGPLTLESTGQSRCSRVAEQF
jgi:hypothetical protein